MSPRAADNRMGERYTVRQVAKMLRVSEETVRRYIRDEKLKATKARSIGLKRVWVVDSKHLNAFRESSDQR